MVDDAIYYGRQSVGLYGMVALPRALPFFRLAVYEQDQEKYTAPQLSWLYQIDNACLTILSLLANVSHDNSKERDQAFDSGLVKLNIKVGQRLQQDNLNLHAVNDALAQLEHLVPMLKQKFLGACATCIEYNNEITVMAWDLLRIISVCLSCPMPLVTRPNRLSNNEPSE